MAEQISSIRQPADASCHDAANSSEIHGRPARRSRRPHLRPAVGFLLCFAGAVALGALTVQRSGPRETEKIPPAVAGALVCDRPVWQVGSVDATHGSTLQHEFVLRNASNSAVIMLDDVKSNCGCLVTEHPKTIKPRESATLPVTLSIPPVAGRFRQQLVVVQDDEHEPLLLTIVGERVIDSELMSLPLLVNFGTIGRRDRPTRILYVQRRDRSPVRLKSVTVSHPAVQTATKRAAPHRVEIEVALLAEAAFEAASNLRAIVRLETEGASFNTLEVPVTAVLDPAEDHPLVESIFVPHLQSGASSIHPLFPRGTAATSIATVSYTGDDGLHVELFENEKDVPHVRVSRHSDGTAQGLIRGNISVRLQDDSRVFELPITAFCVTSR